jgi:pyruvate,water dikinase
MPQDKEKKLILFFEEIDIDDIPFVGGKNASLGEMIRNLKSKGIKIPEGFAITSYAYDYFVKNAGIEEKIREILKDLDTNIYENLATRGEKIRHAIIEAEFPEELKKEIMKAYGKLEKVYGKNVDVAVRSSATAEDLPDASFAGQQETFLNITGEEALIIACKKCFASLFTNRAISYRHDKGFDHFSVKLSIGVQKMVRSDQGSSGVIFTIDTESGFKDAVLITSIFGLGENIVQGTVNPDEFYVFKPTLKKGYKSIISKKLGAKQRKMIYSDDPNEGTKNIRVDEKERNTFSISD